MEVESEEEDLEDIEEIEAPEELLIDINKNISSDYFTNLTEEKLSQEEDEFNKKIYSETKNMNEYLMKSISNFQKIFTNNKSTSFNDFLKYLEKRAIPNNCVCAGVIESIPGWRCVDCSTYENSIYCNDCYKNSKDLHKNHTMYFLYSSGGMCDCGDPGSLKTFCPKHSGPFKNAEEIKKFIEKSFNKKEICDLKIFFDEFFYKFSRYFFILEDYDLFYNEYFHEIYPIDENKEKDNIKKDIILLKKNFCILFQNFLNFLRLISQKNMGMLHLISNYFIKNNLYINSKSEKENEEFMVTHKCYIIEKDNIKILYENGENHKCKCPFIRLFMTNYREEIKSKENENEEFLLSFPHNLLLKNSFCISFFFLYEKILLNNNTDILFNRNQFFDEDTTVLLSTKTILIEKTYEIFYDYCKEVLTSEKYKDKEGNINRAKLNSLIRRAQIIEIDSKYYSKPKIGQLFTQKTFIPKKIIDALSLVHNQIEFKSIYPHPFFQQNKSFSEEFIKLEYTLLQILEDINMYFDWNKLDYSEEIFKYLIYKIMNQEKEGIKQLKENEFSFHLCLYRCFGLLINYFCFNYSMKNNCTLINSINIFKQFFESEKEIELFVDKIMKDYFIFLGFIGGINNNYFNYYGIMNNYPFNYINKNIFIKVDFCTIKYLLALSDKKFDLTEFLKISNIENIFQVFSNIFLSKPEKKENKDNKEKINKESNLLKNGPIFTTNKKLTKIFEYESDKTNYVMQWIFLLDMIITFMRDDSCHYYCLMRQYDEILSSQTKKEMFDFIKNNSDTYEDLKNILIQNIIRIMISCGNLVDLRKLKKHLNKNLLYIFDENNVFEKILEELTENKMQGEIKIFYLKDKYLNNLDMDYYINNIDKSKAQRYIQNFKNDEIKSSNKFYNNVSKISFDFLENTYEKILLNKDNLIMFKKIIEILNENNDKLGQFNRKSLRGSVLPIILNYLSNLGIINTKAFINFKIESKEIINDLKNILVNSIEKNKSNELFGKDLEENIQLVLCQLDYYLIIYDHLTGDLSKLNENDFMTKYVQNIKKESNEANSDCVNKTNNQKIKSQKLKEKFKLKMKNNLKNFMEKAINDKNLGENLNKEIEEEKEEENKNEIMCFYCRNKIELNSWKKPYGKIGLFIHDYFYTNSIKSTIRNEIKHLNKNKEKIKHEKFFWENEESDKKGRIVSCGHYFHYDCIKNINDNFSCPLCLKRQNIVIPPLNILKNECEYDFLNGEKIQILEKSEEKEENKVNIDANMSGFFGYIFDFLDKTKLFKMEESKGIIDIFYEEYKSYFNYLENIFYSEGTTFNKRQQIDNLQNIILSFRYLLKASGINMSNIKIYIKGSLYSLLTNTNENNIINNFKNMYYIILLEKILLSLAILFDYDELKQTFKYILYIFLPYFSFGNYLKYLIINEIPLDKINNEHLKKYIKDNNDEMVNIFKIFLQKLTLIKLITDYNNKNENIIKSFNELSIEKFLSELNIDNLFILSKNENGKINFQDIFIFLPKIFNSNDILFKEFKNDFNDIFNIIIKNIKIEKINRRDLLTKELIINFNPIKFSFIEFDNKIFDWIEHNLEKKCKNCAKHSKYSYICLICGNKVCHTNSCNLFIKHVEQCSGNNSIFIDMDDMRICFSVKARYMQYLFPLYLNENGIGPSGYEMENKFVLSNENLKSAFKNFVAYDYFFK